MKVSVSDSKRVWQSPDGKIQIWDVTLEDGIVMQTYSPKIAAGGAHEVEQYEKNGKEYIRLPKSDYAPRPQTAKFDSEGMAWGNALNNATALVVAFPKLLGDNPELAAKEVIKVATYFMNARPGTGSSTTSAPQVEQTTIDDNLPPVDQLEEPF